MTLYGKVVTGLNGCSISSYLLAYFGTLLRNSHKSLFDLFIGFVTFTSFTSSQFESEQVDIGDKGSIISSLDAIELGDEGSEKAGE